MTAPTTRATPKIALDQRAASRHDNAARSLAWKVHTRCANGYRQETRSMRRCVYRKQLDLETLVCTRGPNFLALKAGGEIDVPGLWKQKVTVVFEPPTNAQVGSG